jgi:hypothetical protein
MELAGDAPRSPKREMATRGVILSFNCL